MSPIARSRQAHAFSTEKKKILQRIRKSNHHVAGREIKSVAEKAYPNARYCLYRANQTQQQTKHKEHKEKHREHRETEVFILKKKNPQYTNKNQTPANPRSRRRDAAACSSSPSSLATHRRSEIGLCSGAPSGPPSRYFSLFISLSLK